MVLRGCPPPLGVPPGLLRPSEGARHRRAASSTPWWSPGWPSTSIRTPLPPGGRASFPRGSGILPQSRSRGRAPSAPRAGSPCCPCACGANAAPRPPPPPRPSAPALLSAGGGLAGAGVVGAGGGRARQRRGRCCRGGGGGGGGGRCGAPASVGCRGGMHLTGCTSGWGGAPPPAPLSSARPPPGAPMPRPVCPLRPVAPLPLPLGPLPAPCPCRGSRPLSPTPWPARTPTVPRPAPCGWAPCPRLCVPFPCPGAFPALCLESRRPLPARCPPPLLRPCSVPRVPLPAPRPRSWALPLSPPAPCSALPWLARSSACAPSPPSWITRRASRCLCSCGSVTPGGERSGAGGRMCRARPGGEGLGG